LLKVLFFTLFIVHITKLSATETCSRIATINFQEVLVDTNSTDKGEGLRFHLEKDPLAKEYLNLYQKNSSVTWPSAVIGTSGTGILLLGFFSRSSSDRPVYLIAGSAVILVNFLIAKTLENSNEKNLTRAVEEYNKRNLPKIYFNPENPQGNLNWQKVKIAIAQEWSF
jgi:hypothetical protein